MSSLKMSLLILVCALLTGCASAKRSISHSAYPPQDSNYCGGAARDGASDPAFAYQGELSEFDVLGIPRNEITSEADIRRAIQDSKSIKLRPGSSILLIQSGALFPDGPMVDELEKHFRVIPFSGVPTVRKTGAGAMQTESSDPEGYSKSLRLTAARGGTDFIVCYWGMLESATDKLPTKTVSWVPIVHWLVPDEKHHMRIQIKVAIVDVRSGNWSIFSGKPFEDARITTSPHRSVVDQKQVERLKKLAFESSVTELVHAFD